jgi:hypothetical protein
MFDLQLHEFSAAREGGEKIAPSPGPGADHHSRVFILRNGALANHFREHRIGVVHDVFEPAGWDADDQTAAVKSVVQAK